MQGIADEKFINYQFSSINISFNFKIFGIDTNDLIEPNKDLLVCKLKIITVVRYTISPLRKYHISIHHDFRSLKPYSIDRVALPVREEKGTPIHSLNASFRLLCHEDERAPWICGGS